MLRQKREPRLGALAFGNVHQCEQHGRTLAIDQMARINRQIDQRPVRLDMRPGAGGLFVARAVGGPRGITVKGLQAANGELLEFGSAIAIMPDRGVVDAEDAFVVQRADDHRDGIAVEQQPERRLALLQRGDVDARTDGTILSQPVGAFRDRIAALELRSGSGGPGLAANGRRTLRLLLLDWPDIRHLATHTHTRSSHVVGEVSEEKVS
jgi:hypothetical protein